jgi:D-beta-D-heptose 7-phosphate kinase/D-beta-D-heptose 1-phosphate adenosyltransferase
MRGPLVVVGDALLDVDLTGSAGRLCPDAPVPVLDDLVERARPGGAGLAAALAQADGHEIVLVTPLGDDEAGEQVEHLLGGVRVLRLPFTGQTAVKKRVRAQGQSLLRLDSGGAGGAVGEPPPAVRDVLADAGAVLVADYGRGTAAQPALRQLLSDLPTRTPLTWDPHPRGASPVTGVRLVTPNREEALHFAKQHGFSEGERTGLAAVGRQAHLLVSQWQAQAVVVTLGERGALLSYGTGAPVVTPAPSVEATDPCGAGDRFATAAALSLGAGHITTEAVQQAVLSAAEYVGRGGASSFFDEPTAPREAAGSVPDLLSTVRGRGGVVVATGGCFDLLHAGHVATLRAARDLGDCLVVLLNSDDSVRRLKGPARPLVPAQDRSRVLEALECVDAVVVFEEDTPMRALRELRPDVWVKGGDYAGQDVPESAVLEEWGGQAVVVPYLDGRSTTRLVQTAVATAEKTVTGR